MLGHLDKLPRLVWLPVKALGDQVEIALRSDEPATLAPGATLALPLAFIVVHEGDFYVPLDRYSRLMSAPGLAAPEPSAQRLIGDWHHIDLVKFPRGEADMKVLADDIHVRGMKARLWVAPLAVAPGSDELHKYSAMLLDKDGAAQQVTWWSCFYLCPGYEKTQQRIAALVRKIIGDWGCDGLKIDGQHLNGVTPCFNP